MSIRKKLNARLDLLQHQRTSFLEVRNRVLAFASLTDPRSNAQVLDILKEFGPQTTESIARRLQVPVFTVHPYILGLRAKQKVEESDESGGKTTWRLQTEANKRKQLPKRHREVIVAELETLRESYPKELEDLRERFVEDDRQFHQERKRFVRELSKVRDCAACGEEFIAEGKSVIYCSEDCTRDGMATEQLRTG